MVLTQLRARRPDYYIHIEDSEIFNDSLELTLVD